MHVGAIRGFAQPTLSEERGVLSWATWSTHTHSSAQCVRTTHVLIMDGTVMAIDSSRLHPDFEPVTSTRDGVPEPRPHDRHERMFVHDLVHDEGVQPSSIVAVRDLMYGMCMHLRGKTSSNSHPNAHPITNNEVVTLLSHAPAHCAGVFQLISALLVMHPMRWPSELMRDERMWCSDLFILNATDSIVGKPLNATEKECLATFISCLCSTSPVCSYFSQDAVELIEPLLDGAELGPDFEPAFRLASPMMFSAWKLFCSRRLHNSFTMPIWSSFWGELCRLSVFCHTGFDGGPLLPSNPDAIPSSHGAYVHSGTCSGFVQVRDRHPCAIDGVNTREGTGCRHAFHITPRKTGGVFTIFCQHGVCLAFFILPTAESRSHAYSYIIKHFATAPDVIVYDFACALEEYFLNRSPAYVKHTRFLIDRMHAVNHISCGPGYQMSLYPQYDGINSQAAEQCNSTLSSVAGSASCMTQVNFMKNIAFFLARFNENKIENLATQQAFLRQLRDG